MLAAHDLPAIADGGSNEILFPRVYTGLTNHILSATSATMADGKSVLALYGTAMYGIFRVSLADVPRPIWSESILTLPPYNLHIYKKDRSMIVYEQPSLITVCTATVSMNGLYYIDDLTTLLHYRQSPVVVSVLDITPSTISVSDCTVADNLAGVSLDVVAGIQPAADMQSVAGTRLVAGLQTGSDISSNAPAASADAPATTVHGTTAANNMSTAAADESAAAASAVVGGTWHSTTTPQSTILVNLQRIDRKGSRSMTYAPAVVGVNPLEVLHISLGHIPERHIKWLVKHNKVKGLLYTYKEIRKLHLGVCATCLKGRMKAFPVPTRGIHRKHFSPGEFYSVDILTMGVTALRGGYKHFALYVDVASSALFPFPLVQKSDLLDTLVRLQQLHNPPRNPKAVALRFINADAGSEQLEASFLTYCHDNNVSLFLAPPKKQQYDIVESFVDVVKSGIRVALIYNLAPLSLWWYACRYVCFIYNRQVKMGELEARITQFDGTEADLSLAVPFYSPGVYQVTREERESKTFSAKAVECRMIGFADQTSVDDTTQIGVDVPVSFKDAYMCLTAHSSVMIRRDCFFAVYRDSGTCLLRSDPSDRVRLSEPIDSTDYDAIFTDHTPISGRTRSNAPVAGIAPVADVAPMAGVDSVAGVPVAGMDSLAGTQSISDINSTPDVESTDLRFDPNHVPGEGPYPYWHPESSLAISVNAVRLKRFLSLLPALDDVPNTPLPASEWTYVAPTASLPSTPTIALTNSDSVPWTHAIVRETSKLLVRSAWIDEYSLDEQAARASRAIRSMFVFKVKSEEMMWRFKARLTAKGFTQRKGIDYDNTYAPTARFESICIVFCLATIHDWEIIGFDVENAFAEGPLLERIDMMLPEDCFRNIDGSPRVVRLNKSLYGIKQASFIFNKMVDDLLIAIGVLPRIHDPCLYYYCDLNGLVMICIVWTDDIVITGDASDKIEETCTCLADYFRKVKFNEEISRYVGLDLLRDRIQRTMTLSQRPYQQSLLDKYNAGHKRPRSTPINPVSDLRTKGGGTLPDVYEQSGEIGYLADRSMPELKFASSQLRSAAADPTAEHEKAIQHVHRYLASDSRPPGITFRRGSTTEVLLFGMSDGSAIKGHDSVSQLAYCFFLNLHSGTVCSRSVKASAIGTAPSDVELKAIVLAFKKGIFLRGLLFEIGYPQHQPTVIYTDSKTVLDQVHGDTISSASEHLILAINYIRDQIKLGHFLLLHVDTDRNTSDVMTKATSPAKFVPLSTALTGGHGGIAPSSSVKASESAAQPFTKMNAKRRKLSKDPNESRLRFSKNQDDEAV
jgi:hypothetical protein